MKRKLNALMGMAFFLIIFTTFFVTAYFLTRFLYPWVGVAPHPIVDQVLTSLVGLFLVGGASFLFSRFFRPNRNPFAPIIEAMESIARGNFNVRVENPHRDNIVISQLTNSVNNMAVELNQMEKMRQEFISNVSHELQSPLTSIRGFARALQNDTLAASERRHYLNIIEIESTRLSKLTDNLLRLACLQAEQVILNPQPYRLDRQIRELLLANEPQWSVKGLEIEVELAELSITADQEMLSQVWSNLIQNGIKFTPQGGTIRLTLRRQNNDALFTIRDSGIGIAAEELPHIFERFYKADKARERTTEGSGLGLAIAHKSIALHRGRLKVESGLGMGSTFTVTLPLVPPHNAKSHRI